MGIIENRNKKVINISEARKGNGVFQPIRSISKEFLSGIPDYANDPTPLIVQNQLWIVYYAQVSSSSDNQDIVITKSKDNGNTWDSGNTITEISTTGSVSSMTAYYDEVRERVIILYEDDNTIKGGYIDIDDDSFISSSSITQPYDTDIFLTADIKRIDRYLYAVVSGYDSGDDTRHPAILESQDGGDTWTVKQKLTSYDGVALSIFPVYNNIESFNNTTGIRIIVGNNNQSDKAYVLYSNDSFSSFNKLSLNVGLAYANVISVGDLFVIVADNRTTKFQTIIMTSKNGIDWSVPLTLNRIRSTRPRICILPTGELIIAFIADYDSGGGFRDVMINKIDIPETENYAELIITERYTQINAGQSITSRVFRNPDQKYLRISSATDIYLSEFKIEKTTLIDGGIANITSEIPLDYRLYDRQLFVKINTDSDFYLTITNQNPNSAKNVEIALVSDVDTNQSSIDFLSDSFNQVGFSRIRNLTEELNLRDLSPSATQFLGWGGLCVGRNDEFIVFYGETDLHAPTQGTKIKALRSLDEGRTWTAPVTLYDTQDNNLNPQNPMLSYDPHGDRYYLTSSIYNSGGGNGTGIIKYSSSKEDIIAKGELAWNTASISNNWDTKFSIPYPVKRYGAETHVVEIYGRDSTDTEEKVGVAKSNDGGETFTLTKLSDIPANESQYFMRYNYNKESVEYIISRPNDENSAYLAKSFDGFASYDANRRLDFQIAGGHIIFEVNGYFVLLGRLNHTSFDSNAYIMYSIDGEAWTRPERVDIPYPVQPYDTKYKNKIILTGCSQFTRSDTGSIWMSEFIPPSYEEITKRLENRSIEAFPRYTTILADGSFETQYMPYKKASILIKSNASFLPTGLKVFIENTWDFFVSDTFVVDITEQLKRDNNNTFLTGIIEPEGRWWRIKLDNTGGAEFKIKGQINIKEF